MNCGAKLFDDITTMMAKHKTGGVVLDEMFFRVTGEKLKRDASSFKTDKSVKFEQLEMHTVTRALVDTAWKSRM